MKLNKLVRERRGSQSAREAAHDIGICATSVLRIEQGHELNLSTFLKIAKWIPIKLTCEFKGGWNLEGTIENSRLKESNQKLEMELAEAHKQIDMLISEYE